MAISKSKLILVIGATGAQGQAVIKSLLAVTSDGSPSPYTVRALTRDPGSHRAQALADRGVEVVEGSVGDLAAITSAFRGVYGAWVNTDGFTVGEEKEIYAGMRIFEIAKQTASLRHFVWSNLDYAFKKGGYKNMYRCEHYDGKGRVGEWIQAQPSDLAEDGMTWSIVTSGPYMDMLFNMMFGPLTKRSDGTHVFASPIGQGHIPMVALSDLGYFARYTFDNRTSTSGQELSIASDIVSLDYLVSTFKAVTGEKAVVLHQSLDDWFANFDGVDGPLANEHPEGRHGHATTWRENFAGWWALWRDDIISRDMDWVRSINPGTCDLERWMKENGYRGQWKRCLLKNTEDGKSISPKFGRLADL